MDDKANYLTKKLQIGSSQLNAVDHPKNKTTGILIDSMPERARERRKDILEYKRSKLLEANYHPWNKSTYLEVSGEGILNVK
jgi:hypothetical protein